MTIASLRTLLLSLVAATALAGPRRDVTLSVTFEGKPLDGMVVKYFDGQRTRRMTTNTEGVVVFRPVGAPSEFNLSSGSDDYVLRNLRGDNGSWRVEALRSAQWRQRNLPRPCDAWRAIMDIPRGSLAIESADEYDAWYASLSRKELANCEALAEIEREVGSKAPWYFYEFKSLPSACADGKCGMELDWTAWYRSLLEKATGASPGKCLSDWEQWWREKGYPPIPDRAE